jgi:glucose-1-phosphatase
MAYRNILFDLGNVLLFFDHGKALRELAKSVNPLTAMLLWSKKDEFLKELRVEADLLENGRMTIEQFFSRLKGKIGLQLEFEQFEKIWCDIFTPNQEMLAYARELSTRYNCYVLSNTNDAHFQHVLRTFPELAFVKGFALSYKLGVMKPAREFFDGALDQLGVTAGESVFIDDLSENIIGAKAAGIEAVTYTGVPQLREALAALGIE